MHRKTDPHLRVPMVSVSRSLLLLLHLFLPFASGDSCRRQTLDFVVLEGDALHAAIEDDIEEALAVLGIALHKRFLNKTLFNAAMRSGDFHLCFSETWGAPYDPVSYATGWIANDEAHYSAMAGLTGDNSRSNIFSQINAALVEDDNSRRTDLWAEVHDMVHQSAITLPLWGKRIPAVLNQRLGGYQAGYQQFDYPVHRIIVQEGSKTVTIAPGAQTGLFRSVGRLDAHSYRPNEFFANNWVYEGLLSYGPDGSILPALAESWTETTDSVTFRLRPGVKFHDGEDWNCAAAKLNFDHVFAEPLRSGDYHAWYRLPVIFRAVSCDVNGDLVLNYNNAAADGTAAEYSNLLQELTFIRPLRMLSPASFMSLDSDGWQSNNSCPTGWGEVSSDSVTITCGGISAPTGTGPFKYVSRTLESDPEDPENPADTEVVFHRHDLYWQGMPDIEVLIVKHFATAAEVAEALRDGSLDMVAGDGVLEPADFRAFQSSNTFSTVMTPVLAHSLVIINSGQEPTNDFALRKAIIHGVDKASIIRSELGGIGEAVDRLFPRSAPYSDVELTPRWDYDIEKATLLNCPVLPSTSEGNSTTSQDNGEDGGDNMGLVLGLTIGLGLTTVIAAIAAVLFFQQARTAQSELKKALAKDGGGYTPEAQAVGNGV